MAGNGQNLVPDAIREALPSPLSRRVRARYVEATLKSVGTIHSSAKLRLMTQRLSFLWIIKVFINRLIQHKRSGTASTVGLASGSTPLASMVRGDDP